MAISGEIITIPEDNVDDLNAGWVGGENVLAEKFDQTFNLVNQTYADYQTYIAELHELEEEFSVPDDFALEIDNIEIDAISPLNIGAAPSMATVTLPGYGDVFFPLAPALKTTPTMDLGYTKPTAPATVNPAIGWAATPYTSEMWLALFTKVHESIENGGTALDIAVEDAIWQRAKDRQRIENEKRYAAAKAEISTLGLMFPQAALRAVEQEISAENAQQDESLTFDIAVKQAELTLQKTQFYVTSGTNIETLLRNFRTTMDGLSLDAQKAAAQLVVSIYTAQMHGYSAEWDGIGKQLDAEAKKVLAVLEENKVLIDGYKSAMDGAKIQTEAITSERDGLVEGIKAETSIYESKTRAAVAWYGALTENQKSQLMRAELLLRKEIDSLRMKLDASVSVNSLREKRIEAGLGVSAQVLSAALNSINTSVTHGTSKSEGRSESWSFGVDLNESHNYSHKDE